MRMALQHFVRHRLARWCQTHGGPVGGVTQSGSRSAIALAFECGEDPGPTAGILAGLQARGLTATFFLDGEWVDANPALVQDIAARGHELGNHGYGHQVWKALSDGQVLADLRRVELQAEELCGRLPRPWVLPPLGALDERSAALLKSAGYRAINPYPLDAHTYDDQSATGILRRALERAVDGAVLLLHTGRENSTLAF